MLELRTDKAKEDVESSASEVFSKRTERTNASTLLGGRDSVRASCILDEIRYGDVGPAAAIEL